MWAVVKRKIDTLASRPLVVAKKYALLFANWIYGESRLETDFHDYERFFKVEGGDIVLDAGACQGLFAKSVIGRAKHIIAVEPDPRNLYYFKARMGNHPKVTLVNKALWNEKGKTKLFIHPHIDCDNLFQTLPRQACITIDTTTLDDLMECFKLEALDFVKMDIEGAELEVLEAAAMGALKKVRKIALEAHKRDGKETTERIAQILSDCSFRVFFYQEVVYGIRKDANINATWRSRRKGNI